MINRPEYIKTIKWFKDTKIIKVITGMRRCGKSYLLNLYIEKLKKEEIKVIKTTERFGYDYMSAFADNGVCPLWRKEWFVIPN